MKKLFFLCIGFLVFTLPILPLDLIPAAIEKTLTDIALINSYFPREEGSPNEKKILSFLEDRLKEQNLEFSRFEYTDSINYHSFSSAIIVHLEGALKDTVLITIPINHPAETGESTAGSINIALGLALLNHLQAKELPLSVQVNFMGAEYGESNEYPLGSTLYLEHYFPEYPVMQLYLNLKNIPDRISIKCGGKNIVSPYWMITACTKAMQAANVPFLIRGNENQLFRFGLNPVKNNIEPFLSRDFPSLSFEGEYTDLAESDKKNWLFNSLNFFEIFISGFSDGIPPDWDRHYLFFQARSFFLIINEQIYLLAVLLILCIAIIYILIFTRISKHIIKLFFRYLWLFFIILGLSFFYIYLSGLLIQGITLYRHNPELWKANPLLFLFFKIGLISLLVLSSRKILQAIPFTENHTFYMSAGIIMLLLILIAVAIINISFTYYFLWAFIFFLFSNISRKKVLRILFFLPSSYWIIKTTIEFLLLPQPDFSQVILLSGLLESLVISIIVLPFVLHTISIIKKISIKLDKKMITLLTTVFFLFSAGTGIYLMTFTPYNENNLQTISVENIIDTSSNENAVQLSGTGSLGNINLWIEDQHYFINTRAKKYIIPLNYSPDLLEIKNTQNSFLDRKNINLSVITGKPSLKIYLVIASEKEFTLFDCNFPFIRRQKGTEYEILIGTNPPDPLPLQLTLPAGYSFNFYFQIEYADFPFRFELSGANKEFEPNLILKKRIQVDT